MFCVLIPRQVKYPRHTGEDITGRGKRSLTIQWAFAGTVPVRSQVIVSGVAGGGWMLRVVPPDAGAAGEARGGRVRARRRVLQWFRGVCPHGFMGTGKMTKLEADFAKVVAVSAERGPHGG